MKTVIEFNHVTKTYDIKQTNFNPTLRDKLSSLFSTNKKEKQTVTALNDVSFSVNQGENVALLGANGAGKTTVLKLLAGISEPTQGTITCTGNIASLMELGAGFHFELSGRENISFYAAILGYSKRELSEHIDQIISFADIGEFIDVPVKKYSNGMKLRLGFSIAIHLNPQIMLVDEILAVGDEEFRKKCHHKIDHFIQNKHTMILVSHHIETVEMFATRALVFRRGKLEFDGDIHQAIEIYRDHLKKDNLQSS